MPSNHTAYMLAALRELQQECSAFLAEINRDRSLSYNLRLTLIRAVEDMASRRVRELEA